MVPPADAGGTDLTADVDPLDARQYHPRERVDQRHNMRIDR